MNFIGIKVLIEFKGRSNVTLAQNVEIEIYSRSMDATEGDEVEIKVVAEIKRIDHRDKQLAVMFSQLAYYLSTFKDFAAAEFASAFPNGILYPLNDADEISLGIETKVVYFWSEPFRTVLSELNSPQHV